MRDRFTERIELAAPREDALLLARVVCERRCKALRGIEVPGGERAPGPRHAMRGHVADHSRQILFRVPAQVAREH